MFGVSFSMIQLHVDLLLKSQWYPVEKGHKERSSKPHAAITGSKNGRDLDILVERSNNKIKIFKVQEVSEFLKL